MQKSSKFKIGVNKSLTLVYGTFRHGTLRRRYFWIIFYENYIFKYIIKTGHPNISSAIRVFFPVFWTARKAWTRFSDWLVPIPNTPALFIVQIFSVQQQFTCYITLYFPVKEAGSTRLPADITASQYINQPPLSGGAPSAFFYADPAQH